MVIALIRFNETVSSRIGLAAFALETRDARCCATPRLRVREAIPSVGNLSNREDVGFFDVTKDDDVRVMEDRLGVISGLVILPEVLRVDEWVDEKSGKEDDG